MDKYPTATPPVATTVRLDRRLHEGLELLHVALERPVNKLINEAVRDYLVVRTAQAQQELAGLAARLEAYRKRDPGFEQAAARFVEAEAALGADDPAEGRPLPRESIAPGSARARVRELLKR